MKTIHSQVIMTPHDIINMNGELFKDYVDRNLGYGLAHEIMQDVNIKTSNEPFGEGRVYRVDLVTMTPEEFKELNRLAEIGKGSLYTECPNCEIEMTPNHYVDEDGKRFYGEICLECGHEEWDE